MFWEFDVDATFEGWKIEMDKISSKSSDVTLLYKGKNSIGQ